MDINNLVSNMTSSDFSDDDVINAVEVAYFYCSSVFGANITLDSGTIGTSAIVTPDSQEGNQQGMSITLLAQAILIEGRKALQTRQNPTLIIRSTSELFTQEMRNMLIVGDDTDEDDVSEGVMWSNDGPTEGWDLGSTGANL